MVVKSKMAQRDYESAVQLLAKLDDLCIQVAKYAVDKEAPGYLDNYVAHVFNTVHPSNRLLLWGLENAENLATMNGIRTLLENWANANYVLSNSSKTEDYTEKIERTALGYKDAFESLRNDPSQGLKILTSAERWTRSSLTSRVEKLGEGPSFQYELLSRYTHADVWTVINDYLIQDKDLNRYTMLMWAIEFINHTLWLVHEKGYLNDELKIAYDPLNDRVNSLVGSQG